MSIIDEVLARYDRKAETYEIELPQGEVFTFRHFKDADDFELFITGAGDFAKLIEKPPTPFKPFMPKSRGVAINVFMIGYLSVSATDERSKQLVKDKKLPMPKMEQIDVLRFTKRPEVFFKLVNGVESAKLKFDLASADEAIDAGKDS